MITVTKEPGPNGSTKITYWEDGRDIYWVYAQPGEIHVPPLSLRWKLIHQEMGLPDCANRSQQHPESAPTS